MYNSRFSRRTFLAGSALAAGAALTHNLRAQNAPVVPLNPEKKIGIALVGIGSNTNNGSLSKTQLFPALTGQNYNGNPTNFPATKYCKLVAMVTGHRDDNLATAQRVGIKPEHVYTYENFDTIKDNPEVDVIYVVLPNSMHCEYTIRAAKAGKHVLCEKPMATSVADCEKMIAACKEAKRKLMVAYRMQYEPLTLKLIDLCRDKDKIGKISHVETYCNSNRNNNDYTKVWRIQKPMSGGGALMDMGIYALQSAIYLIGEDPTEVNTTKYVGPDGGNTGPFRDIEKDIVFDLKFPSGATATVRSTYTEGGHETTLTGDKGSLNLRPLMGYSGNHAYYTAKGSTERTEIPFTWLQHFACEMDDFAQCVLQNKDTKTPGEMGLRDMKIIYGAYESAQTKKPVKLA
jgi:predicted dehydrogenase